MDGKVNLYSLCTSCGLSKSENIDKKKQSDLLKV